MSVLTPAAWNGVSVVTVVVVFFAFGVYALMRGWIVFGPTHREIVKAKDDSIAHATGRELEDAKTISALTNVLTEQRVSGEVSAHILSAIRDVASSRGRSA